LFKKLVGDEARSQPLINKRIDALSLLIRDEMVYNAAITKAACIKPA
jgi:hypothetical protein